MTIIRIAEDEPSLTGWVATELSSASAATGFDRENGFLIQRPAPLRPCAGARHSRQRVVRSARRSMDRASGWRAKSGVEARQRLRGERLDHRVDPAELAQRLRVAARGEVEQITFAAGLRVLGKHLPPKGRLGGDEVEVAEVLEQRQRRRPARRLRGEGVY